MAPQINGRQYLAPSQYDTYEHWRTFALTHGVNIDFNYGNQCWDICCLLWFQYGLWLYTGPEHCAYEIYTVSRNRNAVSPFSKVGTESQSAMERKKLIKRGDCLVFAPMNLSYTGHVCFADEDYNGTDIIKCLGQNQGQGSSSGRPSNTANLNLSRFLGAFRNANWYVPPSPVIKRKPAERRFPWVIYTGKFRNGLR